MPARLNVHYRDRSDLPMSDRDIWLDYKNAKNPRMQVRILAELNETKKQVIEEIINEQRAIEERKLIERKLIERKLILLKEVEQVKQTEEERKAKKAAYMKEYWARKKAEKTEPVAEPVAEPITIPSDPRPDDSELIRKALQNFSIGLEEAIEDQKAVLDEAQRKLTAMEEDLRRCRELLGYEPEVEEAENDE